METEGTASAAYNLSQVNQRAEELSDENMLNLPKKKSSGGIMSTHVLNNDSNESGSHKKIRYEGMDDEMAAGYSMLEESSVEGAGFVESAVGAVT